MQELPAALAPFPFPFLHEVFEIARPRLEI
jgi:hypothetical protein